jgi:DNA uptake protein ComE-like DNA-binding protein
MWVLIALVGLVLVMSRWARVEALASGNRLAEAEAAAAARAGEQYVLAQVEAYGTDATFASAGPADAVQVGTGYFWIIRPDRGNDRTQDFGVDDEGSKVNINTAPASVLLMLPGMTPDIADAIVDWRDDNDTPSPYGAESEYYQALGYRAKNGPFETVEELLLVKGMTPQILYGMDANRNGLLDEEEASAGGAVSVSSLTAGADTSRGLLPFVSVTGPGNAPGGQGQTQLVNVNGNNNQAVQDVLRGALDKDRFSTVGQLAANGRPFRNMIDFYVKTKMKPAEFALVASRLTAGGPANGARVNVNTASREVLRSLPQMEDSDATALVAARDGGADTTNIAWVAEALTDKTKAVAIGDSITGRSYRFSADVVGVSGDGKAYHRVRIMVNGTTTPAAITYRRDLTASGWPMGQNERAALRAGAGLTSGSMTIMTR